MNFNKIPNQKSEWENLKEKQNISSKKNKEMIEIPLAGQFVKVSKSKIKHVIKGISEIAYSMGKTNNKDQYEETMLEDILESFNAIAKKDKKKRKKK